MNSGPYMAVSSTFANLVTQNQVYAQNYLDHRYFPDHYLYWLAVLQILFCIGIWSEIRRIKLRSKEGICFQSIADTLMANSGKIFDLHYKEYLGTLPWRGFTKFIVDSIVSMKEPVGLR